MQSSKKTPHRTPRSIKEQVAEKKDESHVTPVKSSRLLKEPVSTGKLTQHMAAVALDSPKSETPNNVRYSMRQRMKRELSNLKTSTIDSDPEDSEENNSTEEDSDSETDNQRLQTNGGTLKRKSNSGKTFSETYFAAQKQKSSVTSNRTLSSLKLEQTDVEQLQNIVKNAPEYHKKENELLFNQCKSKFEKWKYLLSENFNILLHGVGSKQKILDTFCKECLSDAVYIVVHGFFPNVTLKQVLSAITEDALEYEGKFLSTHEQSEYVIKHFSESEEELYLIIHNLDGMSLRNAKVQTLLSYLAAIPNIHLVCSIDHINSPLMWDHIMLGNFQWVWFDVTNFEPYIIETSYENSIFKDQSSHLLLSSLFHVYRSLTPNGQGVFSILARRQYEEKSHSFSGMAFNEWYQECREAFLVNSEITMQAQLSEFKNHKLLSSRKSVEGSELWYIPVDSATLEQFLESCK